MEKLLIMNVWWVSVNWWWKRGSRRIRVKPHDGEDLFYLEILVSSKHRSLTFKSPGPKTACQHDHMLILCHFRLQQKLLLSSIHISELSAIPPTVWDRLESFLPPQICISTKEVLFSVCFVCLFVHCKASVFAQGFVWSIWRYTCLPLDCCSLPGQDRHLNESLWLWLTLPIFSSCSSNDIIHVATADGRNHFKVLSA